jgi:protein tyrosine phosphatase (PTP) superfamily phosphohydrolase (DUF442 family)
MFPASPSWIRPWRAGALAAALLAGCVGHHVGSSGPLVPPGAEARAVSIDGIENARHVGPRLWSGGEPAGSKAFAALAALGVRTVVSVDGAQPDVEAASLHGLRYVHIPIGYDTVPRGAAEELAALNVAADSGGVFVHCHHGKHRGPTAAAIMAIAAGAWDGATGNAWQRSAGTSPDYAGLYRSVREFKTPDAATLLAAARRLRPRHAPAGLVASMVAADHHAEAMDALQRNGWKPLATRPDESAAQEARLLRELFAESIRLGHGPVDPRFKEAMRRFEAGVGAMEAALRAGDASKANASWNALREDCRSCHRQWRDAR